MNITVLSNGDDWSAVYFDGKKVVEGHEVCWEDVLSKLGHDVSRRDVPPKLEMKAFPSTIRNWK